MAGFQDIMTEMRKESADIGMVVAVIGILVTMILPIPPLLLDFLLALNITLSVIVLITTMYTVKPLDFSIFPPLLLVLTLFRLSVNVASTRLILLKGSEGPEAAGGVIMAFGNFVVGGNYAVGVVIFIILVIVNFKVITAGSGRIAEVAARFTLDAMPGKQMAIDADLNAGMIDEIEAKARREKIAREAEFFGAMDGASKFVRGDAVAGIIITGINIVGGFFIGVFQQGMEMADAASTYTLLTIGDGLVSQIPALIISTAAGLLISRSSSENKMGEEFAKHIFSQDVPIYVGSVIVFMLGLVPGLPAIPFMGLGAGLAGTVYYLRKNVKEEEKALVEKEMAEPTEEAGPEDVEHLLSLDSMELEVGYGLIPLVDKAQDGTLLGRIRAIRRQFASEMGIIIPPIHIRDNLKLRPSEYRMLIKGTDMAGGELMVNHLLAMDPGDVMQKIDGIPTTEPAFNLPALWIPNDREEDAKFAGYTVVDNSTVMATHITEIIRNNAAELMGRQEVQQLLTNLSKTNPKAVEELVPNVLTLGMVQKVIQNLLRERVSVRNLLGIVETLADYGTMSKDTDLLTEYVRQKLGRFILGSFIQPDGTLPVLALAPEIEDLLSKHIQKTEHGSYLSMDPAKAEKIIRSIKAEVEKIMMMNIQPVILSSPGIRRHLRRMIEQYVPSVMVISHAEVTPNISIKAVGKVK
ncbi:MAG: flagellar biosynthesis protein FlhA [Desulfobacteraceae bacterium]